jgi:ParB-like chromosome segregation protein Spo0J
VLKFQTERNTALDPVTIVRIGGRSVLADGHHRFAAYRAVERPDIPVRYFTQGGPRAAWIDAAAENQKTKLTMHPAEKSQMAWGLVISRRYSKADIQRASGASDGNIANMRRVLAHLDASGAPIPELWEDARGAERKGEFDSSAQAKEWAAKITQAIGPAKTFKSLGKKATLVDALVLWSPRLAGELAMLLAEELDLKDQVEQYVQDTLEELGEERLEALVAARAEEMLVQQGKMAAPEF